MTRKPAAVRLAQKQLEILESAVDRMDVRVVGDVVAVVRKRRRIKRQQPERGDAEVLKIIELFGQAREIADAVAVAVAEGADMQFINDRVFVPERIVPERIPAGRSFSALQSASVKVIEILLAPDVTAQAKNMRRRDLRIELDVISWPVPEKRAPVNRSCT